MGDIKNTIIYCYIITVVQKGAFQSLAKNPAQEDFSTVIKEKVLGDKRIHMVLIDHTLTVNQLVKFELGFLHWSRKNLPVKLLGWCATPKCVYAQVMEW